jgi:ABC-type antimicrobial peptide transport system permease subunit
VYHVKSLEEYVESTLAPRTVTLALLGLFSILALVLAGAGVYAVVSYTVGLRRREIGIRMALGAGGDQVIGLVFRESLRPVAAGLAAGIGASLLLDRFLTSLLFEVRPTDWETAAATIAILAAAAVAAAWQPARRAACLDPAVVLRDE